MLFLQDLLHSFSPTLQHGFIAVLIIRSPSARSGTARFRGGPSKGIFQDSHIFLGVAL